MKEEKEILPRKKLEGEIIQYKEHIKYYIFGIDGLHLTGMDIQPTRNSLLLNLLWISLV